MYIESENIELKEKYTDGIIRDIVAFLNTDGGDIYIGVDDHGNVTGIPKNIVDDTQKKISDCITSQIEPNPQNEISVSLLDEDNKSVLKISVGRGFKSIYCIKKYGFPQRVV